MRHHHATLHALRLVLTLLLLPIAIFQKTPRHKYDLIKHFATFVLASLFVNDLTTACTFQG